MNLTRKTALLLALVILGSAVAESALAHGPRSRVRVGLYFGVPLIGWNWYAPPPYYYPYYPSQVVVVPAQPQTYIQQDAAPAAPLQQGNWYYCADAEAYYPYVKQCPGGWQRVEPQPPAGG